MFQTIQACRAVAAILVVLFHAGGTLAKEKYFGSAASDVSAMVWFGGEAGVAFFFVLSGFIIMHVHRKDFDHPERLLQYVQKRCIRVYPVYWIVFLGTYLTAMAVPALRETLPTDPWLLIRSLLLLPQPNYQEGVTGAPVISVAWSLQYEMVFYAVFAIALWRRQLFYFVVLLMMAGIALYQLAPTGRFPGSFFGSHLMILFGMGMLASQVVRSPVTIARSGMLAVASTVAFFATGFVATMLRDDHPKVLLDLSYGVCSAALIVALTRYETAKPWQSRHAASWLLGNASYAIYLVHFPLISIFCKLAVRLLPVSSTSAWLAFVVISLASIGAGVAFHWVIERPLLARLSPGRPKLTSVTV